MIPTSSLGRSGAAFTRLGLGTWAIGGPWRFGWGPVDDAESIAVIRRAVEAGINWIDTAPIYGLGHSEEIVGRALKGYATGDDVFVCTKCGRRTLPDGSPYGDLRPQSIRVECEASLRRLGVERLDLYQIHWPDLDTAAPLEDSWSTMAELVDEGKVRWIGVSNFDVDQLERCEAIRHVDSLQPPLSMVQRGALRNVIPWAAAQQTGVIVYSPMASGLLSGTFDRGRLENLAPDDMRLGRPEFSEPQLSKNLALVERLRAIADDLACGVAELAIAWTLAQEGVTGATKSTRPMDRRWPPGAVGGAASRDQRCDRRGRRGNGGASNSATAIGRRQRARRAAITSDRSNIRAEVTGSRPPRMPVVYGDRIYTPCTTYQTPQAAAARRVTSPAAPQLC
jgi:aryl-alcohol dehydrogenase-like predicted oxidoreductase